VAALLVGAFAAFHGLAHGYELAGEPGAALTLVGMLSATVLLHGAGIGLGWALRHAPRWTPQVTGGAVALLGLSMLTRLA
jgi:urease accessory protein